MATTLAPIVTVAPPWTASWCAHGARRRQTVVGNFGLHSGNAQLPQHVCVVTERSFRAIGHRTRLDLASGSNRSLPSECCPPTLWVVGQPGLLPASPNSSSAVCQPILPGDTPFPHLFAQCRPLHTWLC